MHGMQDENYKYTRIQWEWIKEWVKNNNNNKAYCNWSMQDLELTEEERNMFALFDEHRVGCIGAAGALKRTQKA